MKLAIAIALIVCGTALVMTPAIYDYMLAREVTHVLLTRTDLTSVRGGDVMSSAYRCVCWTLGIAMVGVAVLQSVRLQTRQSAWDHPAAA